MFSKTNLTNMIHEQLNDSFTLLHHFFFESKIDVKLIEQNGTKQSGTGQNRVD